MTSDRIRLFVKPYCPWCRQATEWLRQHGLEHETIDVVADPRAFEEMVRLSGQSRAPVIDVAGKVLADFGADEIAAWWPKFVGPLEQVG